MMFTLFADPVWLLAGFGVLTAAVLLFVFAERRSWKRLRQFAAAGLVERLTATHSRRRLWIKNALIGVAILLAFISLSRPQWGANWEKAETKGIDIMIALDTSKSMLAEDITPNRLERSKLAILDLLNTIQGDRIGLIAFAGNAFLQCPLTLDYQAFRQTLASIDTNTIPVGGTDIAAAIDEADAYFEQTNNDRILILITDGEDLEASGLQRAIAVAEKGTRILTVGVGTSDGELIPIRLADGQQEFLRDSNGKPVATSLDESTLKRIAASTSGLYAPLGPTGSGLERVYEFSLAQLPAQDRQESLQRIPIERFQIPLFVALIFLILETLISTRRRRAVDGTSLRILLPAIISLSGLSLPNQLDAGSASQAQKAYDEGRYEESATLYRDALLEDPEEPKLLYNLGVSAYRSGSFDEAIASFEKTLKVAKPGIQAKAFYNMGNSRVAYGFNLLENQPALTRDLWIAAQTDFENSLALRESHEPSLQNLQMIQETLAAHTYQLETVAVPEEGGTVSPGGPSFHRIPFSIEAKAADGWTFSEWTGEGIEELDKAKTVILLEGNATATATFAKTWNLEVLSADENMGTAGTSGTYREDEPVTLKAEAKDYFAFTTWESETVVFEDATQAEATINLTQDSVVTANFVEAFKLTVTIDPEIGGKAGPSGFFETYSVVPVQAEPRAGFEWVNWEGEGVKEPAEPQSSIAMTGDREIQARMNRIWNLVIVPTPEEGGTTEGAGNHPVGSTVSISAQPAEGFTFEGWEGPGVIDASAASTEVTVQSTEHNLFARFKQDDQEDNEDQQDQDQNEDQEENQDNQDNSEDQQDQDEDQEQEDDQEEEQEEQEPEEEEQSPEEETPPEEEPEQDESDSSEQPGEPQPQEAGMMTPEEARQLLNALSESEQFLPAGEMSQERMDQEQGKSGRDW